MTQYIGNLGWAGVENSDSAGLKHVYVINQLLVNQGSSALVDCCLEMKVARLCVFFIMALFYK